MCSWFGTIDEIKRLNLTKRAKILGKTFEKNLQNIEKKYPKCIELVTIKGLLARLFLRVFWVLKQKRYLVEYLVNVLKKVYL